MRHDEFRFRGGRLCLDLTATVVGRRRADTVDQLATPEGLAAWLRSADLPSPSPKTTISLRVVNEACTLRESIYRLVHPDFRSVVDPEDVAVINQWAAMPDAPPQLAFGARSSHRLQARRPVAAALSSIARDAIDLLSGGRLDRVRECARPDCSVLFVDMSRPGQRRWCDMAVCGNQTKVGRHRRRQLTTT